jgi:hypothetical protein
MSQGQQHEDNPLYGSEEEPIQGNQAPEQGGPPEDTTTYPSMPPSNNDSAETHAYGPNLGGVNSPGLTTPSYFTPTESEGAHLPGNPPGTHGPASMPLSPSVDNSQELQGQSSGASTSPGSPRGEQELIFVLNEQQLGSYLIQRGLTEESISVIVNQDLTGEAWMHIVQATAEEGTVQLSELWEEIGVKSRMTRSRLTSDAIVGFQEWKFQQELAQSGQVRSAHNSEDFTVKGTERTKVNDLEKGTTAVADLEASPKTRYFPKVHYAPKLPQYDVARDMETGVDTFQVYGKTLHAWVEPFAGALAESIKLIMDRVSLEDLTIKYTGLLPADIQLDTELGGHIFSTASKSAQTELFEDSKREFEGKGRTSALKILWTWMELVDSNSKSRMSAALARWNARKPTNKAQDLHNDLIQFKKDMGTMSRLGMGGNHDPVFAGLIEQALDTLVSSLMQEPTLLKMLTVPYATAQSTCGTDVYELIRVLEKCALEMLTLQGSESKNTSRGPPRWSKGGKHPAGPTAAALMDMSAVLCFMYREVGKCPRHDDGKCDFMHTGRTGQLCKDKGYLDTGVCDNYRDCKNCHPWDTAKHGKVEDRKLVAGAGKGSERIQKRFLQAASGKSFAVMDGMQVEDVYAARDSLSGDARSPRARNQTEAARSRPERTAGLRPSGHPSADDGVRNGGHRAAIRRRLRNGGHRAAIRRRLHGIRTR